MSDGWLLTVATAGFFLFKFTKNLELRRDQKV